MNLSISNIAWSAEYDESMYSFLQTQDFTGLEIAPTRIFPDQPYDQLTKAREFSQRLKEYYGLSICSMQSIWYGITQNIFGSDSDREFLIGYTKKAVNFAEAIGCCNLVFGCPKNRVIPSDEYLPMAYAFFKAIGDYAEAHGTTIAIEPNPPYYNTNFINTTQEAFDFCRMVGSAGLMVNVDLGTCINYGESIDFLDMNIELVNHIHISEPMLAPIEKRLYHQNLKKLKYTHYFSAETGNKGDINMVKDTIKYMRGLQG